MTARAQAFSYFVSMGWTPAQAAGLVANLEAESGLRPDAVGDGGRAYGIAQWHPDRQANFSALIGRDIRGSSFEEQLAFVHGELQNWEKPAGDALRACTTAAEAGACVSLRYERPADARGEAIKRAALATKILAQQQNGAGATPAEPVLPTPQPQPETPPAPDLPYSRPNPETESAMPAPLIGLALALLPEVIKLFAPRVQTKLQKVTGADAATVEAFTTDLFAKVGEVVKVADPVANPVQAVAAIQAAPAAAVQQVEAHAVEYLDRLAPMFDRLAEADRLANAAMREGRDAAAVRARTDTYDVAPLMVSNVSNMTWVILGGLMLGLLGTVVLAYWQQELADKMFTGLVALAGALFSQVMKERGAIIAYRFDGTPSSNATNAINSQLAQLSKEKP